MSDYEQYLIEQQAERGRVYNDMTLDERLTEFIEYWKDSTERALAIDAHLEIIKLRRERDNLVAELAAAREALECTFNWAMTEESDPNGGFDIFAEDIVPMIGRILGRE